jgi:hypothetical protein
MTKKIYECKLCCFTSHHHGSYCRHLETNIHAKRVAFNAVQTKYICDLCHKELSDRICLYRHVKNKVCQKKSKSKSDPIQNLDINSALVTSLIKELADNKVHINKILNVIENREQTKIVNNINNNNIHNIHNPVINIQYVMRNYKDAIPVESLTEDAIAKIEHKPDKDLIDCVLHHQHHKTLDAYIANIIVDHYKKDDPSQQSFWNCDSSRLHYIVMMKLKDNTSDWIRDKGGKTIAEKVVKPILSFIKKEIDKYFKKNKEYYDKTSDDESINYVKNVNDSEILGSVVTEISTSQLEYKIIKEMSIMFNLSSITVPNFIAIDNTIVEIEY